MMRYTWLIGGLLAGALLGGLAWWIWPGRPVDAGLTSVVVAYIQDDATELSRWRPVEGLAQTPRFHFVLPPVPGPDSGAVRARLARMAGELAQLDTAGLSPLARADLASARGWVAQQQAWQRSQAEAFVFDPFHGLQPGWDHLLMSAQVVDTRDEVEAYLRRLEDMAPRWATALAHGRRQVAAGQVPPARLCRRAADELRTAAARPVREQPLYRRLARYLVTMDATLVNEYQATDYLIRAAEQLEGEIVPAWLTAATWLDSLAQAAPDTLAPARTAPAYARALAYHGGTTGWDPDSLHRAALAEVAHWQAELKAWQADAPPPWAGLAPAALLARLHAPDTTAPAELIASLRAEIRQARQVIAGLFDSLPPPSTPAVTWEEAPPRPGGATYLPAAWDGRRDSRLLLSTGNVGELSPWQLPVLAYRLGYPGTHLQATWSRPGRPYAPQWLSSPAAQAGWEAYALYLIEEDLKLFPAGSPARLGYLSHRLTQALRLALDTGLFSQGWDYATARQFLAEAGGYPAALAAREIDFCLSKPGAALAAPAGLARLLRLREMVSHAQGETFLLQAFNTRLLILGPLPAQIAIEDISIFLKD